MRLRARSSRDVLKKLAAQHGRAIACRQCFFRSADEHDRNCELCARNPSRAELVRVALSIVVYLVVLILGRLMILGEVTPGPLTVATLSRWTVPESFSFPVDLGHFPVHAVSIGLFCALLVTTPTLAAMLFGSAWGTLMGALAFMMSPFPRVSLAVAVLACAAGLSAAPTRRPMVRAAIAVIATLALLGTLLWPTPEVKEQLGAIAAAPFGAAVAVSLVMTIAIVAGAGGRHWQAYPLLAGQVLLAVALITLFSVSVGYEKVAARLAYTGYGPRSRLFNLVTRSERVVAPDALDSVGPEADRRCARVFALLAYSQRLREFTGAAFANVASRYKESAVAPFCLYNQVRVLSLVLDGAALTEDGICRFRESVPPPAAMELCVTINRDYPDSPLSVGAYLQSARYALRRARFGSARDYCVRLLNIFTRQVPERYVPRADMDLDDAFETFTASGAFDPEDVTWLYDRLVRRGQRIAQLIDENADYDSEPLRIFCTLDPADDAYLETIDGLLAGSAYADCALRDNLRLARVKHSGGGRLKPLLDLLEEYPAGDVVDEVLYRLNLYYAERTPAPANVERRKHYLQLLVNGHPRSVFYPEAAAALERLGQ